MQPEVVNACHDWVPIRDTGWVVVEKCSRCERHRARILARPLNVPPATRKAQHADPSHRPRR